MTEILDISASKKLRGNLYPDRAISSAHIAELISRAHPFKRDEALTSQVPRVPIVRAGAAQKLSESVLAPGS